MGRAVAQRQAALPSCCPRTTSAHGDSRATASLSPRCRSIYLHLWWSFSLLPPPHPCHPLRRGYAEVRQWDNDSTLSTFQIRALSFAPPSSFILNSSSIDLLIFTCSHVCDITEEIAASVMLKPGCKFNTSDELHFSLDQMIPGLSVYVGRRATLILLLNYDKCLNLSQRSVT